MAISVASTYTVLQTALNSITKVGNELSTAQAQLSSGKKSSDFAGIADDAQQYLNIDNILEKSDQYLRDNKIVETRINATTNALSDIITSADSLRSILSTRLSGASNTAGFETQLKGIWQSITFHLNSSVNGQYLFGGTKTNVRPVDTEIYPVLAIENVPDQGYYHGNSQDITVRAQDDTVVVYNARANNPAFQKLFAGLAIAKQANISNNTAQLAKADDFVREAIEGVINLQAVVGAVGNQITTIETNLTNQKLYWKGLQESIGNTDIISVSTQVATNQGILQAAFQAFAKISSLRLSDYLK